jgi:hypothetical protein
MTTSRSDWPALAPAPRHVPASTALGLRSAEPLAMAGWIVLLFALIPLWAVLPRADLAGAWRFRGELESAPARVTAVEATGSTEGGRKGRGGTPILRVTYEFERAGERFRGVSFGALRGPEPGSVCEVEFPAGRPEVSRLRGMRSDVYGPEASLMLLFVAAGGGLCAAGAIAGARTLRLLESGRAAVGRKISLEPLRRSGKGQRRYRAVFEYEASGGRTQRVEATATRPQAYEDPRGLRVIFDPGQPARARVLDDFALVPAFDALGRVRPLSAGRFALALLPPGLVLSGYAAWFAWLAMR